MLYARLKTKLQSFWNEAKGTVTVETVIAIPMLFWGIALTYEFFEIHRYKSAREKATYTIADMISRETAAFGITSTYMDNALVLFNEISNDDGTNIIRVSMIRFFQPDVTQPGEYRILWSQVRGEGSFQPYTTPDIVNDDTILPLMQDGEDLILVESSSIYNATFNVGLGNEDIQTRTFTALRFAPQLCFEGDCVVDS
ncbi:MAG: pilus assembly protein [Pseudomonadota bacterium]